MASQFAPAHSADVTPPLPQGLPNLWLQPEAAAGLSRESIWREPRLAAKSSVGERDLIVTRWSDGRPSGEADSAGCAPGRHEIAIALKTTRLKLFRESQTLFEGLMPAGTLYVADAALPLKIDFQAPCDFIHLSIPNAWLSETTADEMHSLDGFTMRDALAEGLARSLIDADAEHVHLYMESVGRTILMRLLGAARTRAKAASAKIRPLPRWRLKRVYDYVAANIGESISLPELAGVVGLSRMHFAAQFRAATGYRPHEYLLFRRVEQAKALLSQGKMPLVEVALSVGFQSQAHFSTIFKRFTGQTPLGWRREGEEASERRPTRVRAQEEGTRGVAD